ncbi:hypothetical protein CY34DRAFT_683453 [Suillus luteus UH-Slu-Lm8-n1]|uniref:Uncharacterized protein n=1 Tax=Suillus luteus UH-Slu-Lm8-n1 TaxID=930992 RepID=A0A0D0B1D2_9AGAM|nr:hypothetical protein CY34DRAFT_683453 [Suillus luteus UH-Slu-Lm8-n1]
MQVMNLAICLRQWYWIRTLFSPTPENRPVCMTFSPLLFTAAVSIGAIERNARSVTHSSIHRCILVARIVDLKWVAQEGLHFSRVRITAHCGRTSCTCCRTYTD